MSPDDPIDDAPRKAGVPTFVGYFVILVGCLFAIFYAYEASRENAPTPMEQGQPTSQPSAQAVTTPNPKSGPAVAETAPSVAQPKAAGSAVQAVAPPAPHPPQGEAPTSPAARAPAVGAPASTAPASSQGAQPATAQSAASNDDLELAFNGHCRECHSFEKNDNRLGPSLYGVVGRKAGSVPDFNYSDSVKNSGITWDPTTLDRWITNPDALIPNNNMGALFPGLPDAAERAKIIAFLKQDTQAAASIPNNTNSH